MLLHQCAIETPTTWSLLNLLTSYITTSFLLQSAEGPWHISVCVNVLILSHEKQLPEEIVIEKFLSICLSVCPSHTGIVPKRLNIPSEIAIYTW